MAKTTNRGNTGGCARKQNTTKFSPGIFRGTPALLVKKIQPREASESFYN